MQHVELGVKRCVPAPLCGVVDGLRTAFSGRTLRICVILCSINGWLLSITFACDMFRDCVALLGAGCLRLLRGEVRGRAPNETASDSFRGIDR